MKIATADSYRTSPTIPGAVLNTRFPLNPPTTREGRVPLLPNFVDELEPQEVKHIAQGTKAAKSSGL